jgi:hypothetical protein
MPWGDSAPAGASCRSWRRGRKPRFCLVGCEPCYRSLAGCPVPYMSGAVEHVRTQPSVNPRLLPTIDQLLVAGIKLGPRKKHDAINKILELVPGWKRGDCWRRLRQLRRTPALAIPSTEQGLKNADSNGTLHRPPSRRWLQEDDHTLVDLAGYEPVTKIAERLGRSVRAVRCRLGAGHECSGQRRVVAAWIAEVTTRESHPTVVFSYERHVESSRSANHRQFAGLSA